MSARDDAARLEALLVDRVRESVRNAPFVDSVITAVELTGAWPDTVIGVRGTRPDGSKWHVSYDVWKDGLAEPEAPRLDINILDAMIVGDVIQVS